MVSLPDGSVQWTAGSSTLTFRQLASGVVYIASAGASDVFIPEIARALDDEIARNGRILVFANLLEATRIAGEARDGWSEWSKRTKGHTKGLCLVRSKFVEMALSLIAMLSGSEVKTCSDVAFFENAMRNQAPGAKLPYIRKTAA